MQKIDFDQLRRDVAEVLEMRENFDSNISDLSTEREKLDELLDQPEEAYDELVEALDDMTTAVADLNEEKENSVHAEDYIEGNGPIYYVAANPIDADIMEALGDLLKGGRYLDILAYLKSY